MAKFEDRRSTSSAAENMNPRQDLLEEIVKMLKKGKLSYEIRSYLQGKVQNETELEQLIDEARLLMFQKDSKSKPKIHLAAFVLFCLLSIFTIVYLFAFLPSSNFMIGGDCIGNSWYSFVLCICNIVLSLLQKLEAREGVPR